MKLAIALFATTAHAWISNTTTDSSLRAQAAVEAFQHAWKGYTAYAFPHDELMPVSDTFNDTRNGWGASAVDALSTAIIMQQQDIVNTILSHIVTIDYSRSQTPSTVSLFETTIRYLGGMLSGYDLLNGPFQSLAAGNTAKVQTLLNQAKNLADAMKFAFDTPSGIPYNDLDLTSKGSPQSQNALSTIGTLVLEWQRLSDLSGDQTYGNLARKGESYLLNPQPKYNEPFPGLLGTQFNVNTGKLVTADGGWIGSDDSFYEYLLKAYIYDPSRFGRYKDRWLTATSSTMKYLTSHPSSQPGITYIAQFNNKTIVEKSEHLACFAGGNFILGGLVLKEPDLLDYGIKVTEGCYNTYNSTASMIGPDEFSWDPTTVPGEYATFYNQHGFYPTSGGKAYILRPEVIESYYYAYRATKDQKYRDWAWQAFVAINSTCRTPSGFSELNNVMQYDGGGQKDFQDSFLFAEVLKYAYIIHLDDAEWQAGATNQFVFNTEAHPLKVKG